ncbi:MAG: phosphatidate cytidylyltransferase [Campylobacteraceae bacterium 4484_166]|nr:MAG: phosphatidate cytidylyltransferase [Campylobacteraceae bacterium 4484_166]
MIKKENLNKRVATAVALVLFVAFVGLIDNMFLIWFCIGLFMIVSVDEARILFGIENKAPITYALIVWIVALFYPKPEDLVFVVAIVFASILAYKGTADKRVFSVLLYPVVSYLFLFSLYLGFGIGGLLWLIVIVVSVDIGAYFTGKKFGKRKFSSTSPNKTIEGVVGGVTIATIVGSFFTITELSLVVGIVISFVVAVSSIFGDLFESYLKREAGVKDSGNILPGHGGVLDRTDGYLFAGIVMVVLIRMVV